MNRFRTIARITLAIMMVALATGGHHASAQRPGSSSTDEGAYESELTGLEYTWSDDWEMVSADVTGNDEILELESEFGPLYVGFSMEDDAETARDTVVEGFTSQFEDFQTLDEGESRGLAWSLIETEDPAGDVFYMYVEVEEDFVDDFELVSVIGVNADSFIDQYELVNDSVEVDGDEIFDEFDSDEVEELLGAGAVIADEDEATVEDEGEDTNQSETGSADRDDTSAMGDSYMFESADIEIMVTDDIEINDVQVVEDSYEQVLLVGMGSIGAVSLLQSPLDAEETLESFIGGFMSEMEDSAEIDSGVDDDGLAWTMYEANVGGTDMYVFATVNEDAHDGNYLELIAAPVDFFEDEFLLYQDSVEINGEGMFADQDIDDLLDIIDGA